MKRVAAMLALAMFAVTSPAVAKPPAGERAKVSKSHRPRAVRKKELSLAATLFLFPFLLPIPIKTPRTARVDVNQSSQKAVDKGSAVRSKDAPVR